MPASEKDLIGVRNISLSIYVDEQVGLEYAGKDAIKTFDAIGMLFVPTELEDEYYEQLLNSRCLNTKNKESKWYHYFPDCPYNRWCSKKKHDVDDSEIHYTAIRNWAQQEIAKRWLDLYLKGLGKDLGLKFSVLYIDVNALDPERFGEGDWRTTAYARFFRTNLKYALTAFYRKFTVIKIDKIYHDQKTQLEFLWNFVEKSIPKVEEYLNSRESGMQKDRVRVIGFKTRRIRFTDSNHHRSGEQPMLAHFIQLTDLLLGATSQVIFNLSKETSKQAKYKRKVAQKICPIVHEYLRTGGSEPNIRKGFQISFFPESLPVGGQIKPIVHESNAPRTPKRRGKFYKKITPLMRCEPEKDQQTIDQYF